MIWRDLPSPIGVKGLKGLKAPSPEPGSEPFNPFDPFNPGVDSSNSSTDRTRQAASFEYTFAMWEQAVITAGSATSVRRVMAEYVKWRRMQERLMNEAYARHIASENQVTASAER